MGKGPDSAVAEVAGGLASGCGQLWAKEEPQGGWSLLSFPARSCCLIRAIRSRWAANVSGAWDAAVPYLHPDSAGRRRTGLGQGRERTHVHVARSRRPWGLKSDLQDSETLGS